MTYRRKPMEVEAVQIRKPWKAVREFCPDALLVKDGNTVSFVMIKTNEGVMRGEIGDYLIKEPVPIVGREFYPCKRAIFEATYDKVNP